MSPVIENIYQKSKKEFKKIVLPEINDPRVEKAAQIIRDQKIADIITNLPYSQYQDQFAQTLFELRKEKGLTLDQAQELIKNPLYFGTMMVYSGLADGMVAGANNSTSDTIRPALQIIKTKPSEKIASSFFIIETPDKSFGENGVFIFADCGLNIDPDSETLSQIAIQSSRSFQQLIGGTPKIAMLSYSTHNSAGGPSVEKVQKAVELIHNQNPEIIVDGEMQVDAALIPSISEKKYPQNKIQGQANILIFPDLNSGNIAYKLVERLAKANAFGPLIQGLNKPINDLSRGCSVEDIVTTVAITSTQSE